MSNLHNIGMLFRYLSSNLHHSLYKLNRRVTVAQTKIISYQQGFSRQKVDLVQICRSKLMYININKCIKRTYNLLSLLNIGMLRRPHKSASSRPLFIQVNPPKYAGRFMASRAGFKWVSNCSYNPIVRDSRSSSPYTKTCI